MVYTLFIVLALLFGMKSSAAVIGDWPDGGISIIGEIETGDASRFLEFLQSYEGVKPIWLTIDSPGGNVSEAMEIGKLVRSASIPVNPLLRCNSACFLIWAAAPYRRIGIVSFSLHRPFYQRGIYSNLTVAEASEAYRVLEDRFRSYLQEIGVSNEFINRILAYSSNDALFLDGPEILSFISQESIAFEELLIARCDGLTDEEMSDATPFLNFEFEKNKLNDPRFGDLSEPEKQNMVSRVEALEASLPEISEGYRGYLIEKFNQEQICFDQILLEEQEREIPNLKL